MGIIDSKTVKRNKNILNPNTFLPLKWQSAIPAFMPPYTTRI